MRNLIKLSTILFASSLIGCASAPKRPVGYAKSINAESEHPYARWYSFDDFNENLKLKPDAKPVNADVALKDLHKHTCFDPVSKENLEAYLMKWRARYIELEKRCK